MDRLTDAEIAGLSSPQRLAYDYWRRLKGDLTLPRKKDFDPIEIPLALPHVALVEVIHPSNETQHRDFLFKIVGDEVQNRARTSYTGKMMTSIKGKDVTSHIWTAYNTAVETKNVHHAALTYEGYEDFIAGTRDIFLPFAGDDPERVDYVLAVVQFMSSRP